MRPVSPAFLEVLRGSHRMTARARICTARQTGIDPDGVEIPIVEGDVVADAKSDVRATADISTTGRGWSTEPDSLYTPYGNEVFIERGIIFGNGDIEYVSQGYFRMYSVEQSEAPNGSLRISAQDRMSGIIDAKLERPIQFNIGTSFGDAFEFLVHQVYPDLPIAYDFEPYALAFDTSYVVEQDRYQFLKDMATSLGKRMYFGYDGRLFIEDPPDAGAPVATINHGEGGVLVELGRSLDRQDVFNAVVATGESPGDLPPVQAIARDENPASPTYYYGSFGKVPTFYSSPLITSFEQAKTAAVAQLTQAIGLPYNVDLAAEPNPALEPLDPVRITYSDQSPAEVHVLENITTPLTAAGAMTATTREQTRIQIEVS